MITHLEISVFKTDDDKTKVLCKEGSDTIFPKGCATCWSDGDVGWDEFVEDMNETLLERIERNEITNLEVEAWKTDSGDVKVYCHEGIETVFSNDFASCWSDGDMELNEFADYMKQVLLERSTTSDSKGI